MPLSRPSHQFVKYLTALLSAIIVGISGCKQPQEFPNLPDYELILGEHNGRSRTRSEMQLKGEVRENDSETERSKYC